MKTVVPTTNEFEQDEIANIYRVKNALRVTIKALLIEIPQMIPLLDGAYITGGAIGSMLRGEKVNDYDVYFSKAENAQAAKNLIVSKYQNYIKEVQNSYMELEIDGKLVTVNAVTLKNDIQLITGFYGDPKDVRSKFDFVHTMPYYLNDALDMNNILYISKLQYDCCMHKKLVVNNMESVKRNAKRIEKLRERGWTLI